MTEPLFDVAIVGAGIAGWQGFGSKALEVIGEGRTFPMLYNDDVNVPAVQNGFHVSRADGSPLLYNQANTYLPDLLICRPEWAEPVLELVRTLLTGKIDYQV